MPIEVKQLTHTYMPGTPFEAKALKAVSFSIREGEFVGIIGHTGSGKSTLITHLNGLERSEPGVVFVNGIEIPPPDWKQPGMVSTTPAAREQDIPYSTDLLEKPLIDELPTLRAPTKLSLKKGWNYVRIVLPKSGRWCGTFCPVDGTSEHPREVEGLQYASDPP